MLEFEGIRHTTRCQNVVADRLAAFGSSVYEPMFWLDADIPDYIMSAILANIPN